MNLDVSACSTCSKMAFRIPVFGRLGFSEYLSLVLALIFFFFEALIRLFVMFIPQFVLRFFNKVIYATFPWMYRNQSKTRVNRLEKASSFEDMARFWGYDYIEQHSVQTQDGYLLCLHRLPYSKREGDPKMHTGKRRSRARSSSVVASTAVVDNVSNFTRLKENIRTSSLDSATANFSDQRSRIMSRKRSAWNGKPVVLLNHGFVMSSEIWLCNLKESQNLPFLLAERGCDVWFANARGNKYSQHHMSKSPQYQPYWEFSLNEMAMYDLPDLVDYILETTGAPNLTYIGFSQGTAQAFAGLSINPALNEKINLFIALAPATTPSGLHHPVIDAFVKATPNVIYLLFGRKSPLKIANFWRQILSPPIFVKLIDTCCNFLFGWTGRNMTDAQKLVSYQHLYSPTSVKCLVHWFQIIRTGRFQMYDEIPNLLPYRSEPEAMDHIPLRFPTKQIKTPIAIFYGGSDSLVNFEVLSADLPELAYVKYIAEWEHLDFLWAEGIELHVWPDVINLVESFNPSRIDKCVLPEKSSQTNGYANGVAA
ncbi:Alpha/Beta hydrolase protein, partial [Umbelopsis sp. PMI_123]